MNHISAYEQRVLDIATEDYEYLESIEMYLRPAVAKAHVQARRLEGPFKTP